MIIYRNGKIYDNEKPINPEHNGFTLLDACEKMLLCPLRISGQNDYRTFATKPAWFKEGFELKIRYLSDGYLYSATNESEGYKSFMNAIEMIKELNFSGYEVSEVFDPFSRHVFLVKLNFDKTSLIARLARHDLYESYKVLEDIHLSVISSECGTHLGVYSREVETRQFVKETRCSNLKELFNELGIIDELKARLAFYYISREVRI